MALARDARAERHVRGAVRSRTFGRVGAACSPSHAPRDARALVPVVALALRYRECGGTVGDAALARRGQAEAPGAVARQRNQNEDTTQHETHASPSIGDYPSTLAFPSE